MKNLLILVALTIVLCIATACGRDNTAPVEDVMPPTQEEPTEEQLQEDATEASYEPEETLSMAEPEPPIEEASEPTPPLITDEGIVWIVPPTLEHDRICYCDQGGFIDSQRRIICPITGEWSGGFCGHGIGSDPPVFVYDPELHLFGEPLLSGGYDRGFLGMHPFDEASELFYYYLSGFNIIQAVDSTKRSYWDNWLHFEGERLQTWYLPDDAFLDKFAVMYNGEFVTDFIFDDGLIPPWWWFEWQFNAVAMSMSGMWGTIDYNGSALVPFIFDRISYFDSSHALATYDGKQGLIDRYGNVLIPFIFDRISNFDSNRIVAVYDDKHGLIDRYGNTLVAFLFDEIYHFGAGWHSYWIAAAYNGKHGLIDEFGNIVIPFLFDHFFNIDGNTAFAKYDGLYGIIDIHQTIAHTAQQ